MPRLTQSEIHSDFSSGSATWSEYRAQVIAFYDNYPHSELNDHITREFNKKIRDLNQSESLYISPYNAGLRYIGDGVFTVDPLSFNPYFYIDAASSMLGVLESPSLDLNPAVPSTLDIITATRAGTATYTDASGNIQTAAANTVRVDHVDGVPMILVEPAATNLLSYSEDFSQWSNISGGGGTLLTANYGISPDGTQNSTRVQFSGSSKQLSDNITTSSSSTGSVWVKGTSGETIRFGVYASEANFTLNGSWQRIQKQGTATSNLLTINTYGGATARDLEIWGGQLEDGTVATSYIPTSGSAVTRAADDLVIDGSDFTNFYNQSEGTIYVEYEPRVLGTTNTALEFSDGSADNRIFSLAATAYHCYIIDGGVAQAVLDGGTNTAGVLTRLAFSYEANNIQASLDGGAVVSDTSASIPTVDRLILGNQTVANTWYLNGHIKRLIYWPHHSDNI
jgi:hypothetical protein